MATPEKFVGTDGPAVPQVRLRAMTVEDVPFAAQLERESYPHPWSEGIFRDCLRVGYECRAVELNGALSGYGIMSMGAGEAHILNVCIQRDLRCRGLGRRLLQSLLDIARAAGMEEAFLEVRPSNVSALRLYQAMGFEQIGLRKGYYPAHEGREDAVVFKIRLVAGA